LKYSKEEAKALNAMNFNSLYLSAFVLREKKLFPLSSISVAYPQ